jgi:hypothetical protein
MQAPVEANFPELGMVTAARILLMVLVVAALRNPAAVEGATPLSVPLLFFTIEVQKLDQSALLRPWLVIAETHAPCVTFTDEPNTAFLFAVQV